MKKTHILTTAIITLAFLAGCGNADDRRVEIPEIEIITDEQMSSGQSNDKPSGAAQSGEGQQNGQTTETQMTGTSQDNTVGTEFSFADISDSTFYFSSGAGGWFTELHINGDGSFKGFFVDDDMGDVGEAYPNGSEYNSEFSGTFGGLEKVDEYTYKMNMVSLEYAKEPGEEEIIDGMRHIYSIASGLYGGEEFYIFLPGIKTADLPESYRGWIHYLGDDAEPELPFYGLYNITTGDGFSSYVYEEKSLAEEIAMEISFAEERSTELEAKLQEDISQLDMNETAAELFKTWDDTLNIVWKLLEAELDDASMEALRTEEREWIDFKEAEVKISGLEYEGGSMQELTELMRAAELTKDRVYELAEYAE